MEHLEFEFQGGSGGAPRRDWSLVGVVTSGNLEVLVERADLGGVCRFTIDTSAKGFGTVWKAVAQAFMDKHGPSDLHFSINDNAASPPVVSIRLVQALEAICA